MFYKAGQKHRIKLSVGIYIERLNVLQRICVYPHNTYRSYSAWSARKKTRCNTSIDTGAVLPVLRPTLFCYSTRSTVELTACAREHLSSCNVSRAVL